MKTTLVRLRPLTLCQAPLSALSCGLTPQPPIKPAQEDKWECVQRHPQSTCSHTQQGSASKYSEDPPEGPGDPPGGHFCWDLPDCLRARCWL